MDQHAKDGNIFGIFLLQKWKIYLSVSYLNFKIKNCWLLERKSFQLSCQVESSEMDYLLRQLW